MSSGWQESRRVRFDSSETSAARGPHMLSSEFATKHRLQSPFTHEDNPRLASAITRTRDWLLGEQHAEGYWVGELEGDTILESEYILLLAYLNQEESKIVGQCAKYLVDQQLPEGGWAAYPGGPLEISGSVKAYFALKIAGHSADEEPMLRAKKAILVAGGAEQVNSFTRFYLALLGILTYKQCPAVPPELTLIPKWLPFNIYEMSAWSRTIVVPLSIMWAHRPVRQLPESCGIRELFLDKPENLSATMSVPKTDGKTTKTKLISWRRFFGTVDRCFKLLDRLHIRPFRKRGLRNATQWMTERFDESDGLGAIFPPIVWSIVALKCLGYDDDSHEVLRQLNELQKLTIPEGDSAHLQPCKSPVWDTALATLALREAEVPPEHSAIRQSVKWLLSKEVRTPGDWAERNTDHAASGWCFEFNNRFYPDIDDTCMVVMALCRSLPEQRNYQWGAEFLLSDWSPHPNDKDTAAILATRSGSTREALADLESMSDQLTAIWRGVRWVLAMQGKDGGWGAFDVDNNREPFTHVPFADHNAMIDPSTADLSARMLEMFGSLGLSMTHPVVVRSLNFVWNEQEEDHCWFGRWGVNYIYGTWQAIVGLTAIGVPTSDRRIQAAADWLKKTQQASGGWGETPESYDKPELRGQGPVTASQTAWAIMGLLAAGKAESEAVSRGVEYLLETQNEDGTWDEPWFTGTGFPRVFYLKYHYYRIYFPLMALARYARLTKTQ